MKTSTMIVILVSFVLTTIGYNYYSNLKEEANTLETKIEVYEQMITAQQAEIKEYLDSLEVKYNSKNVMTIPEKDILIEKHKFLSVLEDKRLETSMELSKNFYYTIQNMEHCDDTGSGGLWFM